MPDVTFRKAGEDDVPAIVAMLADDELGAKRETPGDLAPYREAFAAIDAHPDQFLVVAELDGELVGTAQLTFMAGMSSRGMTRAQIEAVRVRSDRRDSGVGSALIRWCNDEARRRGCGMVQFTSNASRIDARRFYERLGFTASHVGFKLML